jgi:hypothetical protein
VPSAKGSSHQPARVEMQQRYVEQGHIKVRPPTDIISSSPPRPRVLTAAQTWISSSLPSSIALAVPPLATSTHPPPLPTQAQAVLNPSRSIAHLLLRLPLLLPSKTKLSPLQPSQQFSANLQIPSPMSLHTAKVYKPVNPGHHSKTASLPTTSQVTHPRGRGNA